MPPAVILMQRLRSLHPTLVHRNLPSYEFYRDLSQNPWSHKLFFFVGPPQGPLEGPRMAPTGPQGSGSSERARVTRLCGWLGSALAGSALGLAGFS